MATVEATEFHGVDDDVEIKVEYETYEDLDLTSLSNSDWKLNTNVECRVILSRLPSKIIKREYDGTPEGENSEEAAHFPEHVNHFHPTQRHIKEEPDEVEEDDKDPLEDLDPDLMWKHFATFTDLEAKAAETHTDEKPFKCESCEKIFSCSFDLIKHKKCHQSRSKQHKCETCGKCFDRPSLLKNHMACHVTIKSFKCEVCGKRFSCLRYLQAHQVCHTEIKRNKCDVEYRHSAGKQFKCGECEKEFASFSALNKHMTCHTKPHKCNVCEESFSAAYILKRHIEYRHTTGKSYMCDVCEKEFSCLSALKAHQKRHTVPNHKCNSCEKRFVSSSELNKHMEFRHATGKPYKCDVCEKEFCGLAGFKAHQKRHTVPNHKCNLCEKMFISSAELNKHKRCLEASREGQYKCSICKEHFVTPLDYKARMDSIHPVETENPFNSHVTRLWKRFLELT